jgi:MFS family permease
VVEEVWSPREALKTLPFWMLLIAYGFIGVPLQGLLAHTVMWGVDLGAAKADAGIFMTALSLPMVAGQFFGGWIGDRWKKKWVLVISNFICLLIMIVAWLAVSTTTALMIFAIVFGVVFGAAVVLFVPYLGDLYGRASVGTLLGIMTLSHGLIGGSGPLIWGRVFNTTGSYSYACLISAVAFAIVVVVLLLTKPVSRVAGSRSIG